MGAPVSGNLAKVHILVVDDSVHIRRLITTMLHSMGGAQITEAKDGATAMQHLSKGTTDIALIDWMLDDGSGRNGMDMVREIRASNQEQIAFMPIIMITGHTERENIETARDAGVTEFLAKPFTAKTLYSRIATLVDNPRAFVKTRSFFGPDRRRREEEPETDRRMFSPRREQKS